MSVTTGFVVPAGSGKCFGSPTPGRSFALKLLGRETGGSIMMFEETLPAGTTSLHHLHRDSDEVAWVLAGEFTLGSATRLPSASPALARSFRAISRMPGRTPAAKPAACCFSIPRPLLAASSKRSRSTARQTTTNATSSMSATIGKFWAQTRFEVTFAEGLLRQQMEHQVWRSVASSAVAPFLTFSHKML